MDKLETTSQEGALIAVITNGVEIRIYSPLRGIAFERCLLHAVNRTDLATDSAVVILSKFLSRDSLKSREVHEHLNEREAELRKAFLELQQASDRFDKLRDELTLQVAELRRKRDEVEAQIEQKHIELSQLDERRRAELDHILSTIGLAGNVQTNSRTELIEPEELPPGAGDAIPMSYFDKLILVTLVEMGGSGVSREVSAKIEAKLRAAGKLTPYWEERERTGSRRWQHRVAARRYVLVQEGKL